MTLAQEMNVDEFEMGEKGNGSMQEFGTRREHPELRKLVVEASRALALLDASRLEELALSCQALNRDLAIPGRIEGPRIARQAREATGEMAVLARVLDATRSNLEVMNRLRELRAGRLEYAVPKSTAWASQGSGHGDD
jgi:hypothetical protein